MTGAAKMRVLIVDDDEAVRMGLGSILTDEGYEVMEAENGEEGFAKVVEYNIPIAFSDIIMPKLDGVGFLRKIHSEKPCTEVIMISAYATLDKCVEAIELGACGFLRKPFGIEEVLAALNRAVRNIGERKQMICDVLRKK